jgi:methionyl aminopeptidase
MLVAIEPMISEGTEDIVILDDNWTIVTKDGSIAAHFEHTILVTNNASEIITNVPDKIFNEFFQKIKHLL